MDLPKAFDTLNHDLLIAKLHAYGLSDESLKLIELLDKSLAKTKPNLRFNSWPELLLGLPLGLVLGPLLLILSNRLILSISCH